MSDEPDLLVLGAGPAGIGAAVSAASQDLDVVIVDDAPAAGGRVYRAMPEGYRSSRAVSADVAAGERLREELESSGVRQALSREAWFVAPGFRIDTLGAEGNTTWRAKAIVAATGTHERLFPFAGWTLPGVIGLAAATILLKSQQVLPGQRTVVAGCGPLLGVVAAGIIQGGGNVAAVVDSAAPREWLAAVPALATAPRLLARGLGMMSAVRSAGVPYLFRHAVSEARGRNAVSEVAVAPVDAEGRPRTNGMSRIFEADSLAVGHGLVPSTEVTRLLGADHVYRHELGGWVPVRDADFRTTAKNLYVAGDGAGIAGAEAAGFRGRIAGLAAALDLGRIDQAQFDRLSAPLRSGLRRAERAGLAMARLMRSRPGLLELSGADTVVCRCEDITRAEIDEALENGAGDINSVKAWTRCGMGPCQGRMCGEAAAELAATRLGGRTNAGHWTARVPLRPVPMDLLLGDYAYDDIPQPPPAPE